MVERRHGHDVDRWVDAKGVQGGLQGGAVEVAQLEMQQRGRVCAQQTRSLILVDDADALRLDLGQIVVEGACGIRRGVAGVAGLGVIARGPAAGSAAHRAPGEQHRPSG